MHLKSCITNSLYYILIIHNLIYITCEPVHGRYTRNVVDYQLIIPRKLNADREFLTFELPHFYEYDARLRRKKRFADNSLLNYGLTFDGAHHAIELWSNHALISPDLIFENYKTRSKVQEISRRKRSDNLCYFYGKVYGHPESRVALSTCDGLAGFIFVNGETYFIEPMNEFIPNKSGQLPHVLHKGKTADIKQEGSSCGTSTNWQNAWRERFLREFDFDNHQKFTKRGLDSVHRYLEILIVADKKFLEFHKNSDVDTYILTIVNMVSDYYHDASSGNQIDVDVVRIMYLEKEEEEIDLMINTNGQETLASFCKWQQTINPKDIKHPNHHDIAVLLTRYDICADNSNCGLMGLAYVATACTGDRPCAINEDGGLILGVVVAHEMGHVLGCAHDIEGESDCSPQDNSGAYYVMSPYVHTHTNIWSSCSKSFITSFFDNNLGECLNDEPQESLYKANGMLPGTMYDADYQCNIDFPGSKICKVSAAKFCEKLICQTSPTMCVSRGEPPADGTKCGEDMWCYDGKCIEMGTRPEAINGGWGTWGPWNDCSRTCGGGVSYSERQCNNPEPKHKGRYCLGERKKIKICNTQPCAEGAPSFRAVQCSEFDAKPYHEKTYKWSAFFKEDDPCALYCINTDRVYSKLAQRGKDGTRCKSGTKNMCISGVCRKIGCDYILDSDAVEDECGICKGDGTQCKLVDETYNGPPGHGYVKVVTIPKGSKKVSVDEQKPSDNTIAISAADEKKFYLNGDYTEETDGDHDIGGVEGVYSHPEPNKESLLIYGPLKEDIVLFVVYYGNENVGYRFKYAEPVGDTTYQPHYHWEFIEWGECPVRCGGGVEVAEAECLEAKNGKVSPSFCKEMERPPIKSRKCNEQPCKTKWRIGRWSACTACKFQSGVRAREVECIRQAQRAGAEDVLVDDDKCPPPKPSTRELCNSQKKCSKPKHQASDISPEMRKYLWFQTMNEYMLQDPLSIKEIANRRILRKARKSIMRARQNQDRVTNKCRANTNATLKVGTIVNDRIRPENIKLIEVPLKQSHLSLNLTDVAFETMGDKIPDSLDTSKEIVLTGKDAAKLIKEMQHKNNTPD